MKKNYFFALFASLMLFMAMPATAQDLAISDLFGKWKFTATLEFASGVTDEQKAMFSGDCDVVISEDNVWDAKIVGFAGSQNPQYVHSLIQSSSSGKYGLKINSPDPYGAPLFSGMLLANSEGHNPYNHFVPNGEVDENGNALGDWVVYGPIYYVLNEANNEMTVPDFTVVTVSDYNAHQANVVVKFTNAKITLVEAEAPKAVEDIAGEYVFKAATGKWMTMEGSEIPTEFAVSLVGKSDDNKTYDATIAIEGYDNVTLPATYDGTSLSLAFSNSYIKADYANVEKSIRFAEYYEPAKKEGAILFKGNENGFSLSGGLAFVSDSIGRNKLDTADSTFVVNRQYYADGSLKLKVEEAPAFDWTGVYTVKVDSKDIVLIDNENEDEWAAEFEMKIETSSVWNGVEVVDGYAIKSFMGYDLAFCGGWVITPAADGKSATVALNGYYGMAPLKNLGSEYLVMTNAKGEVEKGLTLIVNEDGTLAIENFAVATHVYGTEDFNSIVVYKNVKAELYVEPVFELAGSYKFTSSVDKYYSGDDVSFPSEFDVKIAYFDGSAYELDSYYYVASFLGMDIASSNMSIRINTVTAGEEYEMVAGGLCGTIVRGEKYYKLYDMNASTSPIKVTVNEDGTISIANFFIKVLDYTTNSEDAGAFYQNVTLAKVDDTAIDNVVEDIKVVEGIFDMQGRKIDAITAPGLYIINGAKVLVK